MNVLKNHLPFSAAGPSSSTGSGIMIMGLVILVGIEIMAVSRLSS